MGEIGRVRREIGGQTGDPGRSIDFWGLGGGYSGGFRRYREGLTWGNGALIFLSSARLSPVVYTWYRLRQTVMR